MAPLRQARAVARLRSSCSPKTPNARTNSSPNPHPATPAANGNGLPPTLGPVICQWIERFPVHGEGDYLGQPFLLEEWQKRIIWRLYEYDPQTGRRLVRRALIILPKGCGKTELVAAIGLAELCGPVLLGPDGKPTRRKAPNIPVAAASYEQADRLYGAAKLMASEGPLVRPLITFDRKLGGTSGF